MNRIFHARIQPASYLLLAILLGMTVYSVWIVNGILIALMLVLLVVVIERIIHTTYTVTTDNRLVIHTGRYSKDKTIHLADIRSVRRIESLRLFGRALRTFVLIETADGRILSLIPTDETGFINSINKRMESYDYE